MKERNLNLVTSAILGVALGDALGLPVQFQSREKVKKNPIQNMTGFGTFGLPPGSWSDDTSLTLCLAESLANGYNLDSIGKSFLKWLNQGYLTPFDKSFDQGLATVDSLNRLQSGISILESGAKGFHENGNGSLMRILPLLFYLDSKISNEEDKFQIIKEVSSITHAHIISIICCYIYLDFAKYILEGQSLNSSYENIRNTKSKYQQFLSKKEYKEFYRILETDISKLEESEIYSDGYVIYSLEATIWCLLNSDDFKNSLLLAVNLGKDSDTNAAITGGLAGIYYGIESIPENWIQTLIKKELFYSISEKLFHYCYE